MSGTEARFLNATAPGEADQYGALLATGFCAMSSRRFGLTGVGTTSATQALNLSFVRAPVSYLVSTLGTITGTTIATGSTLIRFGLYSLVPGGPLTLIGSTPSDLTLLGVASTRSSKALSVPTQVTKGAWYAVGILYVGSGAPTIAAILPTAVTNLPLIAVPRLNGTVAGQADLPSSIANASVAASNINFYFELI